MKPFRKVKLVFKLKNGELPFGFTNCDLVDMESGESFPAKDIKLKLPMFGVPVVNVDMHLASVEVIQDAPDETIWEHTPEGIGDHTRVAGVSK
jgi:hypothetical protein